MSQLRRVRQVRRDQVIACGDMAQPAELPASGSAPSRVVESGPMERWLVTLLARIVAEEVATAAENVRLILRLESLTQPERPSRVATIAADDLEAVPDVALRSLVRSSRRPVR